MKISKSYYPILFFIITIFVTLSSCRKLNDLEFREFRNLNISNLGFSSSQLSIDLVYYNPNNFGLELNRTDLDIYVNGNFLGHSFQDLQVAIPRKDIFVLPLRMDVDMKNLLKNSFMAMLNKTITIRMVGKIKVSKAGVKKIYPVDFETVQQFSY